MKHDELNKRGERWLYKTIRCGFVLTELRCYSETMEEPDLIGWKYGHSYLIESKSSRQDYFADERKHFRTRYRLGMGNYRYYLVPANLIKPEEVGDRWGLLYVYPKIIKIVKPAEFINRRHSCYREIPILCSALRRVHLRGDLHKIYKPEVIAKEGKEPR